MTFQGGAGNEPLTAASGAPRRARRLAVAAVALVVSALATPLALPGAASAAPSCQPSGAQIVCTFAYTGAAQTWTVPAGVTQATFDLYGAAGGTRAAPAAGLGGRATATVAVTTGDTLQVNVGGRGGNGPQGDGGFNGGGSATGGAGAGGGGGTDVRSGAFALADRIIVAGGGGGSTTSFGGGGGGGTDGVAGGGANGGGGGSQTAGGAGGVNQPSGGDDGGTGGFGFGGNGGSNLSGVGAGGGGGGGWWGGGGGGAGTAGGGGGGSGRGPAGVVFETGVRAGDGLATITFTPPPPQVSFTYTGVAQTWTVPAGVTQATFDVYGAQGGSGAKGGRARATIAVTPGEEIQINVGGAGTAGPGGAGGFNGGGDGGGGDFGGGGGGGGSDVRQGGTALSDRVIVAGGGGGSDGVVGGGGGGGSVGVGGDSGSGGTGGGGGTQSGAGTGGAGGFGDGGDGDLAAGGDGGIATAGGGGGGGGGGGYYGGGGGGGGGDVGLRGGAGGGGSGFGPAGVGFETGVRSGNGLVTISYTVPADTTPPVITIGVDAADTLSGSGWYNIASSGSDGVLVDVSATDDTAVTNITCQDGTTEVLNTASASDSFTLGDGDHSISCTASDGTNTGAGPGSTSMPVEIKVDETQPTLDPSVSPSPLYLNASSASASPGASDDTSGVASSSCDALDTSTAGDHTVTCTATDEAGNSNSATVHYTVQYKLLGFFSPASTSKWKTGQTVPVKIALADANGIRISDTEAAGLLTPICRVKFAASGAQTQNATCMKYDAANNQFIYKFKVGNTTGAETISVTVTYPNTTTTTTKSESITIM